MMQLSPTARIFVGIEAVDFRRGIDGLARECERIFQQDAKSGAYFAFRNRANTCFKVLMYDGYGFWLCHRRLSRGCLKGWPKTKVEAEAMDPRRFSALLWDTELSPHQSLAWQRLRGVS